MPIGPKLKFERKTELQQEKVGESSIKSAMGGEDEITMDAVSGEKEFRRRKERLSTEKKTMDGSYSSSFRYSSFRFLDFCHCGTRSPMRISWTTVNPGWHFFGCRMYEVFFSFFSFVYLLSNL